MSSNVKSQKIWEETWNKAIKGAQHVWKPHFYILEKLSESKKGQTLLELGCGSGLTSLILGKKYSMRVIMVDYSRNALNIARKNSRILGIDADLVQGDLRNMPFRDGVSDVVWDDGVNEHFDGNERQFVFYEMARVTRENGKVIIIVPNQMNFLYRINRKILEATGRWNVGFEKAFQPMELCMRMRKSGLNVIAKAGDNPIFSLIQILTSIRGKTMRQSDGGDARQATFIEKIETALAEGYFGIFKLLNYYIGGQIAICGKRVTHRRIRYLRG